MREMTDPGEVERRCAGDTLPVWAARGLDGRSRAWTSDDGRAVIVAAPGLFMRDRLTVYGAPDAVAPLLRAVIDEVGTGYRPMGSPELIGGLAAEMPELTRVAAFGWMESRDTPDTPLNGIRPDWLSDAAHPEVTTLLAAGYPGAWARPGEPGIERWVGLRDADGTLTATGALAFTTPTIGLLAGIAVHPDARGRGLGRKVCAVLIAEALRAHGTAALMVDSDNEPAIRLYRSLGMRYRTTDVAAVHL